MKIEAVALALLLALPAAAQQNLAESVEVHVMEIEAVVLDRAGTPVRGLDRGDFEVKIDGRPVEVTNFFAVDRGQIVDSRDPAQPAAPQAAPQPVPSRVVIVIDDLHLRQFTRKRALQALKSYVRNAMPESTSVTIVRWNLTMRTTLTATSDRDVLLEAFSDMEREPAAMPRAEMERRSLLKEIDDVVLLPLKAGQDSRASFAINAAVSYVTARTSEAQATIGGLSELISMMSGLEGRKTILYVSEALPQQPGVEMLDYVRHVLGGNTIGNFHLDKHFGGKGGDSLRFDLSSEFRQLASLAQSAGVIFSALDPGGARNDDSTSFDVASTLGRIDSNFVRGNDSAGARFIAAETGGRFIENENDLDHAIALLTGDISTYYSLGVRPPAGRAHEVSVRVRGRDELRVLTPRRREAKTPEEALAHTVRTRLYSREAANPLEVRLAVGVPWPKGDRCIAPVKVTVPTAKLTPLPERELSVHAIVVDDRGMESNVRSSTHAVVPGTGGAATIGLDFGFLPRQYVLSMAVVEKTTNVTSYLQTEIDASICGR
jgi:VWFA-related protein